MAPALNFCFFCPSEMKCEWQKRLEMRFLNMTSNCSYEFQMPIATAVATSTAATLLHFAFYIAKLSGS